MWAAAAALLLTLACALLPGFAAAQAVGTRSVLQYHNSGTKAGYFLDADLEGIQSNCLPQLRLRTCVTIMLCMRAGAAAVLLHA